MIWLSQQWIVDADPDNGLIGDGYPDIAVMNAESHNMKLWQNIGGSNNWVKIDLEGVVSNKDGWEYGWNCGVETKNKLDIRPVGNLILHKTVTRSFLDYQII